MVTTAHRYEFGELPLEVHDLVAQGVANGAVIATFEWMRGYFDRRSDPPTLEQLNLVYISAPGDSADPSCQQINIGRSLIQAGYGTCLDFAIYAAALRRWHGFEAWVAIVRESSAQPAHAIVHHPDRPDLDFDPTR